MIPVVGDHRVPLDTGFDRRGITGYFDLRGAGIAPLTFFATVGTLLGAAVLDVAMMCISFNQSM